MAIQTLILNTTTKLYELLGGQPKAVYQYTYDFAVNGGLQGSIPLTQINGALPDKFIAQNVIVDEITPLASGGLALIALTTGQSAGDLVVASAVGGAPWSSAGLKATLILLGTIASQIKMTAARTPAIVVSIADLNAGKFSLLVEGFQGS